MPRVGLSGNGGITDRLDLVDGNRFGEGPARGFVATNLVGHRPCLEQIGDRPQRIGSLRLERPQIDVGDLVERLRYLLLTIG